MKPSKRGIKRLALCRKLLDEREDRDDVCENLNSQATNNNVSNINFIKI